MIIYAANINSGGGLVLLDEAILRSTFGKITEVYIDERCPQLSSFRNINVIKVPPTIIGRIKAEAHLKKNSEKKNEEVLFFGNLPSIFKLNVRTILFLQNAYILKNIGFPKDKKLLIRCLIERVIFYLNIYKINKVVVQTEWMYSNISQIIDNPIEKIHFLPLLPTPNLINEKSYDLIAITGPEEHKNEKILLMALEAIKTPIKVLIISKSNIEIRNNNINLSHIKSLPRELIFKKLEESKYIIILSSFESFCLPYHEAVHFSVKVIAPSNGYAINPDIEIREISLNSVIESINKAVAQSTK